MKLIFSFYAFIHILPYLFQLVISSVNAENNLDTKEIWWLIRNTPAENLQDTSVRCVDIQRIGRTN